MKKLERRINLLSAYAILSTLIFGTIILSSFGNADKKVFDEIDVKRINVLAEDGSLRMVISNETKQHSGRINGKDLPKRDRPAGIIFFNNEGDECGGLIYYLQKENRTTNSGMSFTMDQYHNDQVIQILNDESYENNKPKITRGISINEIPIGVNLGETIKKYDELQKITDTAERNKKIKKLMNEEGGKNRLFIGKNKNDEYGLFLSDSTGADRFRIYLDKNGNPKIQTLDVQGNVKNFLDK